MKELFQAPKSGRVAFSEPGTWYVYDLKGNLVLRATNANTVALWEDCIVVNRKEGTKHVYDPYGTFLFELPQGENLQSVAGVLFKHILLVKTSRFAKYQNRKKGVRE